MVETCTVVKVLGVIYLILALVLVDRYIDRRLSKFLGFKNITVIENTLLLIATALAGYGFYYQIKYNNGIRSDSE